MNINQIMKQAQQMQKKMTEMQEKLGEVEYVGTAGGGMVQITISGKGDMRKISIDPSLVNKDDVEMLEDLIVAAFNDAKKKSDDTSSEQMNGMLGGLGLPPGFKLPF